MGGILQSNLIGHVNSMGGTLVMFSLMLLLTSLAVISPYLWFGKNWDCPAVVDLFPAVVYQCGTVILVDHGRIPRRRTASPVHPAAAPDRMVP